MRARVLYANTHGLEAFSNGKLEKVKRQYEPDLAVIVEAGRPAARRAAREMFPEANWSLTGLVPDMGTEVESGTLIAARRSVLKRQDWKNTLITPQRFEDGQRDKWHPVRRLTRGMFTFVENEDVKLEVGADHAWTHAGYPIDGSHEVPTQHRKQIRAYAEAAAAAIKAGRAVLDVGDMNEVFGGSYVQARMREAGMRPIVTRRLDHAYVSELVALADFAKILDRGVVSDHPAFVFDIKVRA
jgi:hypothetical protein